MSYIYCTQCKTSKEFDSTGRCIEWCDCPVKQVEPLPCNGCKEPKGGVITSLKDYVAFLMGSQT